MKILWAVVMACCFAGRLSAQEAGCDPESFASRSRKEQSQLDRRFREEARMDEIRVVLRVPAGKAKERTLLAMLACKMPVALSNEGMLIADYGSHMGAFANFSIAARAYLLPLNDSTTMVRFVAQEQSNGTYQNAQKSVTNKNAGKSLEVWIAMRNAAKQLLADTTLKADWDASSKLNLTFMSIPQPDSLKVQR